MGKYNPHRPYVLGNEWPGISYEPYPFDLETERGHTFTLDASATIVTGAFYVDNLPGNVLTYASPMISIYRAGDEANTGPTKKLIIPVNGGANITGTVSLGGGSSIAECLATAGDNRYLQYNTDNIEHSIFFDVNSYSTELSGKRILNYAFLYSAIGTPPDNDSTFFNFEIVGTGGSNTTIHLDAGLEVAPEAVITPRISRIDLGNVNLYTTGDLLEPRKFPMRYQDLQRLVSGASPQISFVIDAFGYTSGAPVYLTYAGLEVTYCEENRLAYGGRSPYPAGSSSVWWPLRLEQNIVHIRSVSAFTPGVTLVPGAYTVTLSLGAFTPEFDAGGKAVVSALRQLYALPDHKGVQIVRTLEPGRTPTKTEIDVLPQISLHTATAAVTGVHTYGRLRDTPVYDGVDLVQTMLQQSGGTNVEYPYIRFYARRFGDTNVALHVSESIVGAEASITPIEFDALPEIIAGWREVTLTFNTPSLISNTSNPFQVTWSATGLDAGSPWQILVVDAYGDAGASTPLQLAPTTYAGSSGSTWNSVADGSADAVVMLSQEPFSVTNLTVTETSQALTTVSDTACAEDKCIPSAITFNQLTWAVTGTVCDVFDRTINDSWSDADTGQTWVNSGGDAVDYFVYEGDAYHIQDTENELHFSYVNTGFVNGETRVTTNIQLIPSGAGASTRVVRRLTDTSNYYEASILVDTTGQVTLQMNKRVGGTGSSITTAPSTYTLQNSHSADTFWTIAFSTIGSTLQAKAWREGVDPEPDWQISGVDTSLTSGTNAGVATRRETGNTDSSLLFIFTKFMSAPFPIQHAGVELQRQDDDGEFQTIMRSSGVCPQMFNDYEAPVGVPVSYRIRSRHVYDFYGEWSGTVETTLSEPGVTGAEDGNSVLIFTSNERQDGSANLAYVMTWDSSISEDFSFPEAEQVELRGLYRRDYVVAFKPTERGGARFSRDILVNNVGVSPQRLQSGFRSLRDMAWDDLSYVCVRNELGDRWFAAVQVPSGKVQRNRRLFIARVDITQVTDTPTQVDLSE